MTYSLLEHGYTVFILLYWRVRTSKSEVSRDVSIFETASIEELDGKQVPRVLFFPAINIYVLQAFLQRNLLPNIGMANAPYVLRFSLYFFKHVHF